MVGVGFGSNNHPVTWLDVRGPFKCGSVHRTADGNGLAFNTSHRIQRDVCANQTACVELVGDESNDLYGTSRHFDILGIRAVVNGESTVVLRVVVHRVKAVFLYRHVVNIANRYEGSPHTLFVGFNDGAVGGVVRALQCDIESGNSLALAWKAVVVKVPVDLTADFNLKFGIHRVKYQDMVHGVIGRERIVAGVKHPGLCTQRSVKVKAPSSRHHHFGGVAILIGSLKGDVAKSIVTDGGHRHVGKGIVGDVFSQLHGHFHADGRLQVKAQAVGRCSNGDG